MKYEIRPKVWNDDWCVKEGDKEVFEGTHSACEQWIMLQSSADHLKNSDIREIVPYPAGSELWIVIDGNYKKLYGPETKEGCQNWLIQKSYFKKINERWNELNQKYYFVSYYWKVWEAINNYEWIPGHIVLNEHPFDWFKRITKDRHTINNWKEITKEEYEKFL